MRSKIIALFLISALVLCCLGIGTAYAASPSAGALSTPETIISMSHNGAGAQTSALNIWVSGGYDIGNYYYLFLYREDEVVCISCSCPFGYYNNHFYGSEPNAVLHWNFISRSSMDNSYRTDTGSEVFTTFGSDKWYLISNSSSLPFWFYLNNSTAWSNFEFYFLGSQANTLICEYNLDSASYEPDPKILDAYEAWFNGETYIQVEVNDNILQWGSFVTVHGVTTDSNIGFYHTFRSSDYLQTGVDDDIYYFKLNPRLIPWESFVLDSLEYVGSSDYGSKTVSLPNLTFGYEPIVPTPLVNEYHYNSTTEIRYQYGDASRFIYSMFSAELRLNYQSSSDITFCDEQRRCAQRFPYTTIFLPYCLTDLNIDFEEFFIECVNYYDLVVVDVNSTCFDLLYGSGSYAYLENYLYTNPSKDLANWYSSHYSVAVPLDYYTGANPEPYNWTNMSTCSFYFTTSWFFKETNFLLGDTGTILTELSSRLFEVDGFSDKLLGNMAAWASDQTDFYNVLLPKLTPIISFCNDMTLGDYFNKIVDRLDTIVNNLDIPIDLPIDDDVAAMANAFVEFWTKMFQGASPYASAFASTLQSLVSSDPQVFSLPEDPNNIALPVFPSPSVPLLPTLTPTPVPIGG